MSSRSGADPIGASVPGASAGERWALWMVGDGGCNQREVAVRLVGESALVMRRSRTFAVARLEFVRIAP